MLQQTQVATVIPFYERFMSSFPTLQELAAADLNEVLHIWTGLGYYARARNLHRAARLVVERHGGCLPEDIATLRTLPGIGRSTAGAILALSRSQRHPILDGNARRVLARYFGVEGHAGRPDTDKILWALAEACTPVERVARYTQAIMDLGSTVCTRSRPACDCCPLRDGCAACATGRQAFLPAARPPRKRPHRTLVALILHRPDGAVLLEDRPPRGLWGGLCALPMFASETNAVAWCADQGLAAGSTRWLADYEHAFTHFDLTLRPLVASVEAGPVTPARHRWYAGHERIGLAKPSLDLVRAVSPSDCSPQPT
jgi:A/G-specific adenine glycosylase